MVLHIFIFFYFYDQIFESIKNVVASKVHAVTKVKKIVGWGREKGSTLQDCVKCVLHIRSEVKLDTFVNSALFRFTNGLVLRNNIQ